MKKIYTISAFIVVFVAISLVAPVSAFAQYSTYPVYGGYAPVYGTNYGTNGVGTCVNLTSAFDMGSTDALTGGQVSVLQSFLISQGDLVVAAPTGYFGNLTSAALSKYQYAHGLVVTAYTDIATRSSIQQISCGTNNYGHNGYNNGYQNSYNNYYGRNNCYNNGNNGYTNGVYNTCYNGPVSLSNVNGPTTLTVGTSGVWTLTIYNPSSNYVAIGAKWGDEVNYNSQPTATQSSSVQGQQTISFTHTYQTSGYYTVVFTATDSQGMQTSINASVNVSGNYNYYYNNYNYNNGQPYLSSISPNSGRIGTQVTLYGSGFMSYGNTVHFGNGGMMNLSSVNGTTIYYTIPSTVSGCDIQTSGTFCPMYAQQITPGTYPVYVSNTNGQTSTMYFTVTY